MYVPSLKVIVLGATCANGHHDARLHRQDQLHELVNSQVGIFNCSDVLQVGVVYQAIPVKNPIRA